MAENNVSEVKAEEPQGKEFTMDEVSKHVSKDDLWLVVAGRVFDVTKFLGDHPGGPALLVDNAGRDCTNDFEAIGHTNAARKLMKEQHFIGTVKGAKVQPWDEFMPPNKSGNDSGSYTLLLAILMVLAAVALHFSGYKLPGM